MTTDTQASYSTYQVPTNHAPVFLAHYLKKELGISVTLYKKIKNKSKFWLNGQLMEHIADLQLNPGDVITWELLQKKIPAEPLPLNVCYEDNEILIVNKPVGQLVHPLTTEPSGTLINAVSYYYEKRGIAASISPVQRLDRQTSGLVVLGKTPQTANFLQSVGHKYFWREYLAVCEGVPNPLRGTVFAPIARVPDSMILRKVDPSGKSAVTHYRVLRTNGAFSLLSLRLSTGRTHQIRVHMASIGHPLAGDELYGGSRDFIGRQALHAAKVILPHPLTREKLTVKADLPRDMQKLIGIL